MRKFMMLMSAAAMAVTMPALAQPQGKGKGNSAKAQSSAKMKGPKAQRQTNRTTRQISRMGDVNNNGILDRYERDGNRDGVLDYRQGRVQQSLDRNGNGILDRYESGAQMNMCPPGLAKKSPACIPPGQAKRMFDQGQRLPTNYRSFTDYNDIPLEYRNQYGLNQDSRYIYRDQSIYVVDPTTRLVTRIIDLLL